MKRQLMIPLMALALLPVSAQKLVVAKSTVNAGRTGYQQPITATFELRNKSKRKLIIESVKPDCGCTAVEYPKEVGANYQFLGRHWQQGQCHQGNHQLSFHHSTSR